MKLRCLITLLLLVVVISCNRDEAILPPEDPNPPPDNSECAYYYMAPDGDDTYLATKERPAKTFERVEAILKTRRPDSTVIVRIYADRGDYVDYNTLWEYYNPDYLTIFQPYPDSLYAPFVASNVNPPDALLFRFEADDGMFTNIRIERFLVRNYVRGVFAFVGDREDKYSGWNGNNVVKDCLFRDIGNEKLPGYKMAYSVIGVVNSRANKFMSCEFVNIANANRGVFPQELEEFPSLLAEIESMPEATTEVLPIIGFYFAHHSTNNLVIGCTSHGVKGDMIRLRDASHDNVIEENYFRKTGWTAVCTMWYCLPTFGVCTKIGPECSSWENIFKNNICEGNWECNSARVFYDMKPMDRFPECPAYAHHERRIHLIGNTFSECDTKPPPYP